MKNLAWTVLLVVAFGTVASAAEEMVANPAYKMWSAYKPGTTSKSQMTSVASAEGQDMNQKMMMTMTLKEITPDKAVIEAVLEMEMEGNKMSMPAQKTEIPAKVAKSAESQPASMPGTTMTKKGEGDEEITVGGKKYKTHWIEYQVKGQTEGTSKTWTSESVPGGLVKSQMELTKPVKMKTTTELVEFKAAS